jgi:GDPmannose 4,6-dehydratase
MDTILQLITERVSKIWHGLDDRLLLGNLEARRDWGFAGDYVKAMWMMLQQPTPQDFVIGTGITHSVRDFVREAFEYLGLDYNHYVTIDPALYRPAEVDLLCANNDKAQEVLGWQPEVQFNNLVGMMVDFDLQENCRV